MNMNKWIWINVYKYQRKWMYHQSWRRLPVKQPKCHQISAYVIIAFDTISQNFVRYLHYFSLKLTDFDSVKRFKSRKVSSICPSSKSSSNCSFLIASGVSMTQPLVWEWKLCIVMTNHEMTRPDSETQALYF